MKILFLTNNEISENLINWLRREAKENVTVFSNKILKEVIENYQPDLVISYNYRYIIKKDILDLLQNKIINLHISFLPWNKGAYPNMWSFLEDTPKGITIHQIDAGIDTGNILFQKKVNFEEENETLSSSYKILHEEIQNLFKSNWRKIKNFRIVPRPQPNGGSIHYIKDFERIKHILGNEGWDLKIPELKIRFNKIKEQVNNEN